MVGNTFAAVFMIENTVLVKEIEKYSSCNTLVSVTEAMIFGDEIKKIGRFFFKGRVNILTAETLVDIADAAFEGIVFSCPNRSESAPKRIWSIRPRHSS